MKWVDWLYAKEVAPELALLRDLLRGGKLEELWLDGTAPWRVWE